MQQVPPAGDIERPPIQLNETYFAVKNKAIASWVSVKVIEFTDSTTMGGNMVKSYKIRYLNTPYQMIKTVTAKHLAYFEPPPVRLTIGKKVIYYCNCEFIIVSYYKIQEHVLLPISMETPCREEKRRVSFQAPFTQALSLNP